MIAMQIADVAASKAGLTAAHYAYTHCEVTPPSSLSVTSVNCRIILILEPCLASTSCIRMAIRTCGERLMCAVGIVKMYHEKVLM